MITNIVGLTFSGAVALFAFLAWRANRSYARICGIDLMLRQIRLIVAAADSGNRRMDVAPMKLLRKEWPDIYESLKVALGTDTRQSIEG
jgi:hypothetical protein